MRRFAIAFLCCLFLVTAVSAAGSVTDLQSGTTVASDGTCQVVLTVQLRLEEAPGTVSFPLPADARHVSVDGSSVRTQLEGGKRTVDLSGRFAAAGTYTFVIRYDLPDAVTAESSGKLHLKLEILSGFGYPIEKMRFSVTLPGTPEGTPAFTSTYHQEAVDALLSTQVEGSTIQCEFLQSLNDHETLSMDLPVTQAQFPQSIAKRWSLSYDDILMYILLLLALLYWLAALRFLPGRSSRQASVPTGIPAGELGCRLTGVGVDFAMTVVSWAQMGYLLIQLEDSGRVLLHKRMDMGNERSEFENRYFSALFGKRRTVDGTGFHYARLCAKASRSVPGRRGLLRRSSGNVYIFRGLCAGIGVLDGISLAKAFTQELAWQIILGILLSAMGGWFAWQIQSGAYTVQLRRKFPLYRALAFSLIWLLLGVWSGEVGVVLFALAVQWLGGFAAAYGGKRTELGRETMGQIQGLRHFLRTAPRTQLLQILRRNPDYYYRMAPYAMALGVDRTFARHLGNHQLPECTYLVSDMGGHMTASEWNRLLRETVAALDEHQIRLPWERFMGK